MFEEIFEQGEFASCEIITFQVMTIARVSPGNPDAVDTMPERSQDEFRTHPCRAGDPDHPDVRRILKATYPGKIGCAIAAPVAKESGYPWLPVIHCFLLILSERS